MKEKITIDSPSDIQVGNSYTIHNAIVHKIESEGNPDSKVPAVLVFKLEQGGFIKISSWQYDKLDIVKKAMKSKELCDVDFFTTEYKNSISVKLDEVRPLGTYAKAKATDDSTDYKSLIDSLIAQIYDKGLCALVKKLIVPDFYVWPAASSVHHAYPGGLAEHTYGVTANAINEANLYQNKKGMAIDFDLIIAGGLIHDIGKLDEYSEDGEATDNGHMISHIIFGIERIDAACDELKIDKTSPKIMKLKHIIVSHHGKYEFGSPNLPVIPEAYIISQADYVDAKMEIVAEELETLQRGDISKSKTTLDGSKVFKI